MANQQAEEWWRDEDRLLMALDRALHPAADVPDRFLQAANACYAWRLIDAEFATLAYDSVTDHADATGMRAEAAPLRALTFETNDLTFELEVMPDGLAGQLIPAQTGELAVQFADGQSFPVRVDSHGYFVIRPTPKLPFRLQCSLPGGRVVSTTLITL